MERKNEELIEELLTVAEFAEILRVDDTTVRRWIVSGALSAVQLPHSGKRRAYRIRRSTMQALLNTGEMTTVGK